MTSFVLFVFLDLMLLVMIDTMVKEIRRTYKRLQYAKYAKVKVPSQPKKKRVDFYV